MTNARSFRIDRAVREDVTELQRLVRALADYERLSALCTSTEADLDAALFGAQPAAEALIVRLDGRSHECIGFALFFHTYSTFLGRRSLWLEDLFVMPVYRGLGIGRALLVRLAALPCERGCGRFEWAVLDWNAPSIAFYRSLGAEPMDGWTVFRLTGPALRRAAEIG